MLSGEALTPIGFGNYVGPEVSCEVQAGCSDFITISYIRSFAFSGLACPNHNVYNRAAGGWNTVDTINANTLAIDYFNFEVRGISYAQESCSLVQLAYQNDYPNVCDDSPPNPDEGGGGTEPQPVLCFYGGFNDADLDEPSCDSDQGLDNDFD